jgi:hypothetical protein
MVGQSAFIDREVPRTNAMKSGQDASGAFRAVNTKLINDRGSRNAPPYRLMYFR